MVTMSSSFTNTSPVPGAGQYIAGAQIYQMNSGINTPQSFQRNSHLVENFLALLVDKNYFPPFFKINVQGNNWH